jgi:nicotinate phosphoribosyltransferase
VRIDSGNLDEVSRVVRRVLDEAGMRSVRIFASGGLDEHDLERLVRAGAPIDAFGVGTRVGVSADAPYLDSAYKLVEYDGRPMLKLSAMKATAPGRKQVFRGADGDTIGLRNEPALDGHEPLLVPVMHEGRRTGPHRTLQTARHLFEQDLQHVPERARSIGDPEAPVARFSDALQRFTDDAKADALRRVGVR